MGTTLLTQLSLEVLAQQEKGGPLGPEFGKASPIGLLIILVLLVVVIALGISANRRVRRVQQRRMVAEQEGIDPFDVETLDRRIKERGLDKTRRGKI